MKFSAPLLAAAVFAGTVFSSMAAEPAPYRHVVIFGFKKDAPAAKVEEVVAAFKALKTKIPSIQSFEHGKNDSVEKMNPDLTHVFTLTFKDKASLEKEYLHHPEHEKFVTLVKPIIEKAVVVDYTAE